MIPIDELLSRFEGVKKHNGYWMALCPAHPDQNPSLSISVGDKGAYILKCHANCSAEDVVRAAGLAWPMLFPGSSRETAERTKRARRTYDNPIKAQRAALRIVQLERGDDWLLAAAFDYTLADSTLIAQTLRFQEPAPPNGSKPEKTFRPLHRNSNSRWEIADPLHRWPPYRLVELTKSSDDEIVYVVEGEAKCDMLRGLGVTAVGFAHGAKSVPKTDWTPLQSRKRVVLLCDNDEPGRGCMHEIARDQLGSVPEIRIVALPGLAEHGDIDDFITERRTAGKSDDEIRAELVVAVEATPLYNRAQPKPPTSDDATDEPDDDEEEAEFDGRKPVICRRIEGPDDAFISIKCRVLGWGGRVRITVAFSGGGSFQDTGEITRAATRDRIADALAARAPAIDAAKIVEAVELLSLDVEAALSKALDNPDGPDGPDDVSRPPSDGEVLAAMVIGAPDVELFHTPGKHDAICYATIKVDGHRETLPLSSTAFEHWIVKRFRDREKRTPGSQAVSDGLTSIRASAMYDGLEHPVFIRVAEHDGSLWIDLCDEAWSAVQITPQGWRHVTGDAIPVKFVHRRGMKPLPVPIRGGSINELRPLVNLPDDDAWVLFVLVLVTYFMPHGPYVVLVATGEQGTAKSTLLKLLRALLDPNTAALRRPPRDDRDLMIAACNAWIVGFDNVSHLSPNLSDALCTLATGGGFGTRELYSDDEEKLFDATRPVIINGIGDVITRNDLLDRAIVLTLPPIPDDERQEESALLPRFEAMRARALGALLDAVAVALRNKPSVSFTSKPRMADFAVWAVAAAPAFGWTQDVVLELINANRARSTSVAIEASAIGPALLRFMDARTDWLGTGTSLLEFLAAYADEKTRKRKDWPQNPRGLRSDLQRIAPSLRRVGIETTFDLRSKDSSRERQIRLQKVGGRPSEPSRPSDDADPDGAEGDGPTKPRTSDGPDDLDGRAATSSVADNTDRELLAWVVADPERKRAFDEWIAIRVDGDGPVSEELRVAAARTIRDRETEEPRSDGEMFDNTTWED